MQVLKEDVRARIIESATQEFLKNGFNKASMRDIAKNAEITVGNIYRYFDNKEDLFNQVVEPCYNTILKIIDVKFEVHEMFDRRFLYNFKEYLKSSIIEMLQQYGNELIVMVKKSQGTKFEAVVDDFAERVKNKVIKYMVVGLKMKGINLDNKVFPKVVAQGFINGLIEIIYVYDPTNPSDLKAIEQNVEMVFLLYFNRMLNRFDV